MGVVFPTVSVSSVHRDVIVSDLSIGTDLGPPSRLGATVVFSLWPRINLHPPVIAGVVPVPTLSLPCPPDVPQRRRVHRFCDDLS